MRADRGGFTLVELVVAMAIGAVVLIGARGLLDGLSAQTMTVQRVMRESDRRVNAVTLARQLVGNLAIAPDTTASLVGSTQEARFTSWCPSPRAGTEPCAVRLFIREHGGAQDVVMTWNPGVDVVLLRGTSGARLRYLVQADDGGSWRSSWNAGLTIPPAIGIITDADTMLLRVGERR